jgi:uncharacterized protein YlxW (UPF0749 family)
VGWECVSARIDRQRVRINRFCRASLLCYLQAEASTAQVSELSSELQVVREEGQRLRDVCRDTDEQLQALRAEFDTQATLLEQARLHFIACAWVQR